MDISFLFFLKQNCTPSGKKMVTGVPVVTASQVQSNAAGGSTRNEATVATFVCCYTCVPE